MFLDIWMLVLLGIWWAASVFHISRQSRAHGISLGLNCAFDALGYKDLERIKVLQKIIMSIKDE